MARKPIPPGAASDAVDPDVSDALDSWELIQECDIPSDDDVLNEMRLTEEISETVDGEERLIHTGPDGAVLEELAHKTAPGEGLVQENNFEEHDNVVEDVAWWEKAYEKAQPGTMGRALMWLQAVVHTGMGRMQDMIGGFLNFVKTCARKGIEDTCSLIQDSVNWIEGQKIHLVMAQALQKLDVYHGILAVGCSGMAVLLYRSYKFNNAVAAKLKQRDAELVETVRCLCFCESVVLCGCCRGC